MGEQVEVTLTVNGDAHEVRVSAGETLADVLREKLGLTGTKVMCDEGECGSCTVLVNGTPVLSCLTLAVECQGKDILTVEGLADPQTGKLHPLQQTFVQHSGMQCGTCTPGMLLTAKALLDSNASPAENEVREALSGNLCRCGNYKRIVQCVMAAADMMKGATRN